MKKAILLSLFLCFTASAFNAAVVVYDVNAHCAVPEWETPNFWSPDPCELAELDFLGETISFHAYGQPLFTDSNGVIEGPYRVLGIAAWSSTSEIGDGFFEGGGVSSLLAQGLAEGSLIDGAGFVNSTVGIIMLEEFNIGDVFPGSPSILFESVFEPYIGFQVSINGNIHYGWAEVWPAIGPFGEIGVELMRVGIESLPDYPIVAGSDETYFIGGPFQIQGTTFFDSNGDGVQGMGESDFQSSLLNFDNGPSQYSGFQADNPFDIYLGEGDYTIESAVDTTIWTATTPLSYSVSLNANDSVFSGINFGYQANGVQEVVNASLSAPIARCNTTRRHYMQVNNIGNTNPSGLISYSYDPNCQLVTSNPPADSIAGNTLYFSFDSMSYGGYAQIEVDLVMPSVFNVGDTIQFHLEVYDESGTLIASDSQGRIVRCAFDPNDITELNGYTENGFFLPGDRLEYHIRFQNTGNDTAYQVTLIDQLSNQFDLSTFQAISWSHPNEAFVTDEGELVVTFDNIFLADSTTNEPESHGFFRFSIQTLPSLAAGDSIQNGVGIYFDQNPPVLTNTEVNYVFDCTGLAEFSLPANVCEGESLEVHSTLPFIESYSWQLDGATLGSASSQELVFSGGGDYLVSLAVENPLCNESQTHSIEAWELDWIELVQVGQTLSANTFAPGPFIWYLNGEIIDGTTSETYSPSVEGTYQVTVVGGNGCLSSSEEFGFMISSVDEYLGMSFQVSPNPVSSFLTLTVGDWNGVDYEVQLINPQGKVVRKAQLNQALLQLDDLDLASGIYSLNILDQEGSFVLNKTIVFK